MNRTALRLPAVVLAAEGAVGVTLLVSLVVFGPQMLLLDPDASRAAVALAWRSAAPTAAVTWTLAYLRLREYRYLLRALARGTAFDAGAMVGLASLPGEITVSFVGVIASSIAITLLTPLRPRLIDVDAAQSLGLLGFNAAATLALPLYVVVRTAVSRTLELAEPERMRGLLEREERSGNARRWLIQRLLTAVAAPVGVVALGSSLLAHAHIRRFDVDSRIRTARALAEVTLHPLDGSTQDPGRTAATDAAAEYGFSITLDSRDTEFSIGRRGDGRIELVQPTEGGSVTVRFAAGTVRPIRHTDLLITLAAVLAAALVGLLMGRTLADDLSTATWRVRMLRTDKLLHQSGAPLSSARFLQVALLNRSIDTLADRFRVFTGAQERAIEARRTAQRVRSLLFASVSHDLRSPLNSILGFAELIRGRNLSPPQRESLRFIDQSGRELLTLIETILDSAKLEAQRVTMVAAATSIAQVAADAVRNLRQMAAERPFLVELELDEGPAQIWGDGPRLSSALASLIWYTARTGDPSLTSESVRAVIRARSLADEATGLDVSVPGCALSTGELRALLAAQPGPVDRRKYGVLALGLEVAQAVIELHGGSLDVRGGEGAARFEIVLPARRSIPRTNFTG